MIRDSDDKYLINSAIESRRELLSKMMGQGEGTRDLDKECRYPAKIDPADYHKMWERFGVARRVVSLWPSECWSDDPAVYATEESEDAQGVEGDFQTTWDELIDDLHIFHYLYKADVESGIGRFGVILLGIDDGKPLREPVDEMVEEEAVGRGVLRRLEYLRVFNEAGVEIKEREKDTASPRYGLPTMYKIAFQDSRKEVDKDVHWHRVVHIADDCSMSEVYGTPRMQSVYNHLLDLRKVLGGAGEMFWKGAFPGYSFEIDPTLRSQDVKMDSESLRQEMWRYSEGLQRYLATIGVGVKSLSPQVADPSNLLDSNFQSIALMLEVPLRTFLGSEQAHLASSQDARNWAKRVNKRIMKYVEPLVLRRFIDRLIALGVLPGIEEYFIHWPSKYDLSEKEKSEVAKEKTETLSQYVTSGLHQLIPPRIFLLNVMGMDEEEVDAIEKEVHGWEEEDEREEVDEEVVEEEDEDEEEVT